MDMFEDYAKKFAPLAERMRPRNLSEFVGQEHIIYPDSTLVKAITRGTLGSVIFYGPPGTGKTTLANIISNVASGIFKKLNAISSGVSEAKEIISEARQNLRMYGKRTYLLLDECHRWNKAQSDSVLQAVEDGSIILIGSTTENPYTSMTRAIVSRCKVYEFKPLSIKDIALCLKKALADAERGLGFINTITDDETLEYLANQSGGDLRTALNNLELIATTLTPNEDGKVVITKDEVDKTGQHASYSINTDGYYDILSAFCKSLRGSDAEAALYYCAVLLEGGIAPEIIARRMIAHASEDIGMADSNALLMANNAMFAVKNIGLPECKLSLSHAIIYLCEAPKSNSVYLALNKASQDAMDYPNPVVPNHLKNHPVINGKKGEYLYPHDFGGYVKQQYMPDNLTDRIYYVPSNNGRERGLERKKVKY